MNTQKNEKNLEEIEYIDYEETEYIVAEKILQKRVTHEGKLEYFLKWKNLPDSDNVWIPVEVLGCPELGSSELINAYEDSLKCEIPDKKRKFGDTENSSSEYGLKKKAYVLKSNNAQVNINSLPQEILFHIFRYLSCNDLGRMARVCKKWCKHTKCPLLWKRKKVVVAVHFEKLESENKELVAVLENLPSSVIHLKLDFQCYHKKKWLKFKEFCVMLAEKCPSLKTLQLVDTCLSVNLQSAFDLCRQHLHNLEVLSFRFCFFGNDYIKGEYGDFSKIKIFDLQLNQDIELEGISFPKKSCLRKLVLFSSGVNDIWFQDNIFILENLEVLFLQSASLSSWTFQLLLNHAVKLTELHLCKTCIKDIDFQIHSSLFPQLKTICLRQTDVTYKGIVHLIQSCNSLQNVYVDPSVAESYALHPFVVSNECKLEIVKASELYEFCEIGLYSSELDFF